MRSPHVNQLAQCSRLSVSSFLSSLTSSLSREYSWRESLHVRQMKQWGTCVKPVTLASRGGRKPSLYKEKTRNDKWGSGGLVTQTTPSCMTLKDFLFGFVHLGLLDYLGENCRSLWWQQREIGCYRGFPWGTEEIQPSRPESPTQVAQKACPPVGASRVFPSFRDSSSLSSLG